MTSLPASVPGVITCKAVVSKEARKADQTYRDVLEVMDILVDPPQNTELRVKMLVAGICRTDVINIDGYLAQPQYSPRVLGHEGVGIVESMGPDVKDFKVGDVVISPTYGECGVCSSCRSGRTNVCQTYGIPDPPMEPDGTSRFHYIDKDGKKQILYYFLSRSTWTQYMVVDSNYAAKLTDYNLPPPHCTILSCAFATGYGAAWLGGNVQPGDTVAVFGVGSTGLSAVIGAKHLGATKIIAIDNNLQRKEVAMSLGATDFIYTKNLGPSISDRVLALTGGIGADCCIEAAGSDALMNEAMKAAIPGKANTVIVGEGIFPNAELKLDFSKFVFGHRVEGAVYGNVKIRSALPTVVEKLKDEEIRAGIERLLAYDKETGDCGYQVDIRDGSEAIYTALNDYVTDPNAIKVVIKLNDYPIASPTAVGQEKKSDI